MMEKHDLYIDSNVWNFLFDNKIDLRKEFPLDKFELFIVGEQELENTAIPDSKLPLRKFIIKSIGKWGVKTHRFFGFYDERHPKHEQRMGGFGVGHWSTPEQSKFMEKQRDYLGESKKRSGLYSNEADIALAARSSNAVVLTLDEKKGPLRDAKNLGWGVVYLSTYDKRLEGLFEYCMKVLKNEWQGYSNS